MSAVDETVVCPMSPRLSVVVPVHHAGGHLQECLRSLAAQTMPDLEVVLVTTAAGDPDAPEGPEGDAGEAGEAGEARLAAQARKAAAAFAADDDRFRVVERDRDGGLGEARATGLRHTDPGSTYLAFVNPADTLPPDAYALLTGSLEETGSDFATGNVLRLRWTGTTQAGAFRKPMEKTRPGTHITRHRALAQDRPVWNKVFRRAFWERHDCLAWPDGPLPEDTPVTLPAHYLAEAVDVLSDHVYHWRELPAAAPAPRPGGDLGALRDRLSVADGVSRLLAALDGNAGSGDGTGDARFDGHAAKRHYDSCVLTVDMAPFLKALPRGDEHFQGLFTSLASDFAARVDPAVFAGLPVGTRMKWHLIRERRTADLLDALAFERDNPRVFRTHGVRARRAAFQHPDGREIPVPRAVARPRPGDLPLVARLREARWQPDGTLLLRGYAYVRSVDAARPGGSRKVAWLRQQGSRRRLPLRVRTVPAPEATRNSRQRLYCYDAAGFELTVDPARLLGRRGTDGARAESWTPVIGVLSGGLLRRGRIEPGGDGSGAQPQPRDLGDGWRLVPAFRRGRLRLAVEETQARLEDHGSDGTALELTGTVRERHRPVALLAAHQHTGTTAEYPVRTEGAAGDGWTRFTVRVPLAELTEVRAAQPTGAQPEGAAGADGAGAEAAGAPEDAPGQDAAPAPPAAAVPADGTPPLPPVRPRAADPWRVTLTLADGTSCRIVTPLDIPLGRYPLGGDARLGGVPRELCLSPDPGGHLMLTDRTVQPVADTLAWSADGELLLSGSYPGRMAGPRDLVWQHSGHREEVAVPVEREGDRFTARLRPATAALGGLPLRQGRWYPFLRVRGAERRTADVPLRLRPALHAALPSAHQADRAYTLERRFHDRLFLLSGSVLGPREQGAYQQQRLSTVRYPAARRRPLRDAVLYHSFDGRQFSDSPRALYEELRHRETGLEHLWAVRDGQAVIPAGARAVVMGGAEWHEALARSRWLVGNTHFPRWFSRREGQVAVQTWHGTPLKRIGLDLAGTTFANHDYLSGLTRRTAEWSLLLSPNRFSTPILRRAFGYQGEILESGYPRNDLLYAADRDKHAEEVRTALGIPEGKRVVLYAPTWRDDSRFDRSNCRFDLRLELDAARSALGSDHVLLVRKHYLVADAVPGTGDGFVRDVSAWPDLAELLLIADVLVTDYSSLMFDFAHTGRPMLFFTYDLERYRDVLRGFYFDFAERAPGPLLATSDEVIGALREVETVAAEYTARYAEFQQAFCDLDDGRAAARVVDRMLALAPAGGTGRKRR